MKPRLAVFVSVTIISVSLLLAAPAAGAAYAYAHATGGAGSFTDEGAGHAAAASTGELTTAGAIVDLASGTLRSNSLAAFRYQYAQADTLAFDTFTLLGLPFGTAWDIAVALDVSGTIDAIRNL